MRPTVPHEPSIGTVIGTSIGTSTMAHAREPEIQEIVAAARLLPADARAEHVEHACGDDAELRRLVEQRLRADEVRSTPPTEKPHPLTGKRIGPHRLVREIGRGGAGSVWLAERVDGSFEQRVAVKLLRGLVSEQDHDRFENERRVLAGLEHPNIARLYDGGTTEDGIPYLVMEYVEGQRIDDFCALRMPTITDIVRLVVRVCRAVQVAHDRRIVHRDLKPGNVLIDSRGEPRLLDFGISKVLDAGEDSDLTRTGQRVLTPRYASPEQIAGKPVTPATDVHGLGVLLYEACTGHWPFGTIEPGSTRVELRVLTTHPVPPSRLISATDDAGGESETRTALRRRRTLAGDLDTIILQALRKEPERRYPDAGALADDLERFLDGRPIGARRDSLPYRVRKYLGRHRAAAGAACVAILATVLGVLAVTGVLGPRHSAETLRLRGALDGVGVARLTWQPTERPDAVGYRMRVGAERLQEFSLGVLDVQIDGLAEDLHEFRLEVLCDGVPPRVLEMATLEVDCRRTPPRAVSSRWRHARTIPFEPYGGHYVAPHYGASGRVYLGFREEGDTVRRGALFVVEPGSDRLEPLALLEEPVAGLCVCPETEALYFAEDYPGRVLRWDLERGRDAGAPTEWASGFHPGDDDPCGLAVVPVRYRGAVAAPGEILVVDRGYGGPDEVWRIGKDASEGARAVRLDPGAQDPLVDPVDIAVGEDAVYLADPGERGSYGSIYILAADGAITPLPTRETLSPMGICSEPLGDGLIVADSFDHLGGRIVRVDPATGEVETLIVTHHALAGDLWNAIDVRADGRELVTLDKYGLHFFERVDTAR